MIFDLLFCCSLSPIEWLLSILFFFHPLNVHEYMKIALSSCPQPSTSVDGKSSFSCCYLYLHPESIICNLWLHSHSRWCIPLQPALRCDECTCMYYPASELRLCALIWLFSPPDSLKWNLRFLKQNVKGGEVTSLTTCPLHAGYHRRGVTSLTACHFTILTSICGALHWSS